MVSIVFKSAILIAVAGFLFGLLSLGSVGGGIGAIFGGMVGVLLGSFQKESVADANRRIAELEQKVERLEGKE